VKAALACAKKSRGEVFPMQSEKEEYGILLPPWVIEVSIFMGYIAVSISLCSNRIQSSKVSFLDTGASFQVLVL
jgi:hypothetical protein